MARKKSAKADSQWDPRKRDRKEPDPNRQYLRLVARKLNTGRGLAFANLALVIVVLYLQLNPAPVQMETPAASLDPMGKQYAWARTEEWLQNGLPLGAEPRIVSWDGSKARTVSDGSKDVKARRHDLTVDTSRGWWKVHTVIEADGSMLGYPTVERVDMPLSGGTPDTGKEWTGVLRELDQSEALTKALTQWGAAIVGKDNDLLTVLMKDPDPDAKYAALAIGEAKDTRIDKANYLNEGKVDKDAQQSDRAVVRVTVTLAAQGENLAETQMSFDVKIADPDGTPAVLAWGAPGDGPTLKDYQNRWEGVPPDWEQQAKKDGDGETIPTEEQSHQGETR